MPKIFYKNTHQFTVKKAIEPLCTDEAIVRFCNRQEIQTFFNDAFRSRMNLGAIQQIAKDIAPTFCRRHVNNRPQLSSDERMDFLFSEIQGGNAKVILKNKSIKYNPDIKSSPKGGGEKIK